MILERLKEVGLFSVFDASGSKSNSMIESLKILLERGMTKAKLKPQSVRKQQLHILSRTERHLVIFLTWTIFMVCVFRYDYRMVLFFS